MEENNKEKQEEIEFLKKEIASLENDFRNKQEIALLKKQLANLKFKNEHSKLLKVTGGIEQGVKRIFGGIVSGVKKTGTAIGSLVALIAYNEIGFHWLNFFPMIHGLVLGIALDKKGGAE